MSWVLIFPQTNTTIFLGILLHFPKADGDKGGRVLFGLENTLKTCYQVLPDCQWPSLILQEWHNTLWIITSITGIILVHHLVHEMPDKACILRQEMTDKIALHYSVT